MCSAVSLTVLWMCFVPTKTMLECNYWLGVFFCWSEFIIMRVTFKNYYFLFICVFCLCACLCTMYMPGAHRSQKKASVPLELEIQMVVHCHVGAKNWTQFLKKNSLRVEPSLQPLKSDCIKVWRSCALSLWHILLPFCFWLWAEAKALSRSQADTDILLAF